MTTSPCTVYRVVDVCLDGVNNTVVLYLRDATGRRCTLPLPAHYTYILGTEGSFDMAVDVLSVELQETFADITVEKMGERLTYYRGYKQLLYVTCHNYRSYTKMSSKLRYDLKGKVFSCDGYSSVERKTLMAQGIYGCNYITLDDQGVIRGASPSQEFLYVPVVAGVDLEMLSLNFSDPDCELYMGSYYSEEYSAVIYTSTYCEPLGHRDGVDYICVATKYDLASTLAKIISQKKPDVVTGYNIYNADIPLLYHTLGQVLARWPSMEVGAEPYYHSTKKLEKKYVESTSGVAVKVPGCSFIDMYSYLDSVLSSEDKNNMTLGDVSARYLGSTKDPFSYRDLYHIYYSGDTEEKLQVMRYCLRDSELSVMLYSKFNVWNNHWSIYSISSVEPQESLSKGIVDITYGACYSICKELQVYVDSPNNAILVPSGGLVLDSVRGFYNNVYCVDFNSLYPSIAIQHNIDSLSLLHTTRECIVAVHGEFRGESYYEITADNKVVGLVARDNSMMYFDVTVRTVLPTLLKKLLSERQELKLKLKMLDSGSLEHLVASSQEQARKLCANGACGSLAETTEGNPMSYCALNDIITTTGRRILTVARRVAARNGYKVIYGDTDSLMISTDNDINSYIEKVHKVLPQRIRFKVEYKADSFIMGPKKHYIVKMGDTVKIAGYKAVKSSSCRAAQMVFRWVVDVMLSQGQEAAVLAYQGVLEEYTSPTYEPDLALFCTNFSYKGKVYAEGTSRAIIVRSMRQRGVEVTAGNSLLVLTVKTREDYMEQYRVEPPIVLPGRRCSKSMRVYTYDEVKDVPSVVDVGDILETQCGSCVRSIAGLA